MKLLKKYLLDILVVIVFAVISFVYFMPADMDGRILFRHDSAASKGLGHEKELFQDHPMGSFFRNLLKNKRPTEK